MNYIQTNFDRNNPFRYSFFPKSPYWDLASKFDVNIAIDSAIGPIRAHYKIELIINHSAKSIGLTSVREEALVCAIDEIDYQTGFFSWGCVRAAEKCIEGC